ncbi:hypothetical protein Y032_0275g1040 [Ancylostoma ceylanicum]|nr:hypothetical protein Y032_0275g1040 [Ancylostoma ceylanicum]
MEKTTARANSNKTNRYGGDRLDGLGERNDNKADNMHSLRLHIDAIETIDKTIDKWDEEPIDKEQEVGGRGAAQDRSRVSSRPGEIAAELFADLLLTAIKGLAERHDSVHHRIVCEVFVRKDSLKSTVCNDAKNPYKSAEKPVFEPFLW